MGSMFTRPILKIVKTAQRISKGNLDESFSIHRNDEVGSLALILNQLTQRLKDQIKQGTLNYERYHN